jgi:alpha-L-fucosidase
MRSLLPLRTALLLLMLSCLVTPACAESLPFTATVKSEKIETPEHRDSRMQWWREARLGLFVHWGIYSVAAGSWHGRPVDGLGEWIMNTAKIPISDYAGLADELSAKKFDAESWVQLAKSAGCKYIIITAKHHDGFAMFRSEASSFNVYDRTPFKRDPLKELANACRKHGIKLGFYYSQSQDWSHAGGAVMGKQWDPAQTGDMDLYIDRIAVPQVRELLTGYGEVSVFWWDTPANLSKPRADKLAELLKLQPGIITNNRLGGDYRGDTETPENKVPATGYPGDWEVCMTMNDTWGYKSADTNWKSADMLIRNLIDIASKGGNLLLNVGPTAEGEIPMPSIKRLQSIGEWMKLNGIAIYGCQASPFKRLKWGRATRQEGKLYLHVIDWPADGRLIVPMSSKVRSAYLLRAPDRQLRFERTSQGLEIDLASNVPDPVSTTVVLDHVGVVEALPAPPIMPDSEGAFELLADAAELAGPSIRIEGNTTLQIGAWNNTDAWVQWPIYIDKPGRFEVSFDHQVAEVNAGSEYVLMMGEKKLELSAYDTSGRFSKTAIGSIAISKTGPTDVVIRPTKLVGAEFIKLRSVTLKRVGQE